MVHVKTEGADFKGGLYFFYATTDFQQLLAVAHA